MTRRRPFLRRLRPLAMALLAGCAPASPEDRAALREVYAAVTALVHAGVIDGLVERRKQLRQ